MILRPIISQDKIERRVAELAEQIRADYAGRDLTIVAVMKGAIFFVVDMVRRLDRPLRLDLVQVASYMGTDSSGNPRILTPIGSDLRGQNILVVDDVLDTGLTLQWVTDEVKRRNPESVKVCVLLTKKCRRQTDVAADYSGFDLDSEFVVGYGLDLDGQYRNLPYIAAVE